MNAINDYMKQMIELGCSQITFAIDDKSQCVVAVKQLLNHPTGVAIIQHQCAGPNHQAAAEDALDKATICARLRPAELSVV